jgi:hypothetical protein
VRKRVAKKVYHAEWEDHRALTNLRAIRRWLLHWGTKRRWRFLDR